MLYADTVKALSERGADKSENLRENPAGFFRGSLMAGVYVGFGIVLIFALGAAALPGAQKVVMASAFGIALTLVVFAGAEFYTGLGENSSRRLRSTNRSRPQASFSREVSLATGSSASLYGCQLERRAIPRSASSASGACSGSSFLAWSTALRT